MTARRQKMLVVAGIVVLVAGFVAANAHLLVVAIGSQPACIAVGGAEPARRAC